MARQHLAVTSAVLLTLLIVPLRAEDWPEYRGKGRVGVWTESGILEKFPEKGLKVLWRTPIKAGFTGPSVSDGRVFVTDFEYYPTGRRGTERAIALDEKTGKVLWTHQWEADYGAVGSQSEGPRATPTVDGDRVYVQGTDGKLFAFNVKTGAVLWQWDYVKDFKGEKPGYGYSSAPIVDGNLLIAMVGAQPDGRLMALDKMTGKEVWRALSVIEHDIGTSQPIIITASGKRQLINWDLSEVASLNPQTGEVYWRQPWHVAGGMTVAVPVLNGPYLLISTFYSGSLMLRMGEREPGATVVWKGKSVSEIQTDGLHSVIGTPVIDGDYLYGLCSFGQLRALKTATGERVWETQEVTKERRRWVSGFIVRNGDRYFINNDRGELIIARLTPERYEEISRTHLIKPTTPSQVRRELGGINWVHPAYANRHLYTRNDEEIIAVSLAADGT